MAVNNQAYSFLESQRKIHHHATISQTVRLLYHELCDTWELAPKTLGIKLFSLSQQATLLCNNRAHTISEPLVTEAYSLLRLKDCVENISDKANLSIEKVINTPINEYPFNGLTIKKSIATKAVSPANVYKYINK